MLPPSAEDRLAALIEDAADGRATEGRYHNIDPVDEASTAQFIYVEEWLDVNGEAVLGVRPGPVPREGAFRFTRSADGRRPGGRPDRGCRRRAEHRWALS